jgi:hypothetical protein
MTSSGDETLAAPGAARAAGFGYWWRGREKTEAAAADDGRFDPGLIEASVRRVIAAWAAAAGAGQDDPLGAAARPAAISLLLHPDRARPRARLIAADVLVDRIYVSGIAPDREPPRLSLEFTYGARRSVAEPGTGTVLTADDPAPERAEYREHWQLAADGARPWPWRLWYGFTETVEELSYYNFLSRLESPEEYRGRTGRPWPAAGPPARRFRIQADYAEHDEKIGGAVVIIVEQDAAPPRAAAEQLAWPLVQAEVQDRLGPGEWRPSLNTIEVLGLLD